MQPDDPTTGQFSLVQLSWIWFATAAALLIAGSIYAAYAYDRIPDPIVAHWNLMMDPDRYAAKSLVRIFSISGTGILIVSILFIFSSIIRVTAIAGHSKTGGYESVFDRAANQSDLNPIDIIRNQ